MALHNSKMKLIITSDNDKIPDECAYCNKPTVEGHKMFLPNREYERSKWHSTCFSRFVSENITIDDDIDYILDNLPNSFIEIIQKANAREEQYHYRQIVLTV
jgi:hypothetical protein